MSERAKLPRMKAGTPRRESNAWLEADRREKMRIVVPIVVVLAILAVGAGIIVFAMME